MAGMEIEAAVQELREHNDYAGIVADNRIRFALKEKARPMFSEVFSHYYPGFIWCQEYDQVVDWLSDNKGRGLLLFGAFGRGKTVIAQKVIPTIFYAALRKVIAQAGANDLNGMYTDERGKTVLALDALLQKRLLAIDDIGTEEELVAYGQRRWALPEIVDNAEKRGNLLILTSNLGRDHIIEKYGTRTMERITAITQKVRFQGESLRK